MTITNILLVTSKFIETSEATQFTATATTIIDAVSVTNVGTESAKLNISLVRDGDAASNINKLIFNKTLRKGDTWVCPELLGQILDTDDFMSAITDVASTLNIRVSGRVITS